MKYIYIEDYLQLSKDEKVSFFYFLNKSSELKVVHQEIIFEEEAILIGLENTTKIEDSLIQIKDYFNKANINSVNIDIVKKHTTKFDKIILTFIKVNKHILI